MYKDNYLITITGPSGSGKTSLVRKIIKKYPHYNRIITHTTRTKRPREQDKIDYHFLSNTEFHNNKDNNIYLETMHYDNNFYGSPKKEIHKALKNHRISFIILDPKGAKKIRKRLKKHSYSIYIDISRTKAIKNMKGRNSQNEGSRPQIDKEIFKYKQQQYDFYIKNDEDLKALVNQLESIIISIEERKKLTKQNKENKKKRSEV